MTLGLAGNATIDLLDQAIERARNGDRDAIQFLYIRYADGVHSCIARIVHDSHEAEDLTQTVFIKMIRVIHRYEDRGLPFVAWLHRVARNTAFDYLRGAGRQVPFDEVREADRGDGELDYERLWSLRSALEQLPPAQREVFVLRQLAGLSPGEIANRLGKSEGSVHGLHHRARGALRSTLRELDTTPAAYNTG